MVCSVANAAKATLVLAGSYGRRTNITGQFSFSQKYLDLVLFINGFPHFGQLTIFNTSTKETWLGIIIEVIPDLTIS